MDPFKRTTRGGKMKMRKRASSKTSRTQVGTLTLFSESKLRRTRTNKSKGDSTNGFEFMAQVHLHEKNFYPLASVVCPPAVTMDNLTRQILLIPESKAQELMQFRINKYQVNQKRGSFMGSSNLFKSNSFSSGLLFLDNGKLTVFCHESGSAAKLATVKRTGSKSSMNPSMVKDRSQRLNHASRDLLIIRRGSMQSVSSKTSKVSRQRSKSYSGEEVVFHLSRLYDVNVKGKELSLVFHQEVEELQGLKFVEVQFKAENPERAEEWAKKIMDSAKHLLTYIQKLNEGFINKQVKQKQSAVDMCEKYVRIQLDLTALIFGQSATETCEAVDFFISFLKSHEKETTLWEHWQETCLKNKSLIEDDVNV